MQFLSKLKNTAAGAGIYLCYLLGASILTMLVEAMFIFLLDHIVLLSYPTLTVIRIVIYVGGCLGIMGFLGYFEGYRESECAVGEATASFAIAVIPYLLLSMLFKFQGFISGPVRFVAGLIHNGKSITYESLINETPYGLFLLVFLGYVILCAVTLIVCKFFGTQKRVMDRASLRKHEEF